MIDIQLKRLDTRAKLPVKAYAEAACWDFFPLEDTNLREGETKIIPVGWAIALPKGYRALWYGRSSQSKHAIMALPGMIDSDYRGEIGPRLYMAPLFFTKWNLSDSETMNISDTVPFVETIRNPNRFGRMAVFTPEDPVGQLEIVPVLSTQFTIVDKLPQSDRGDKGFGSSSHTLRLTIC